MQNAQMHSQDVRDVCYMMMNDITRVKNPELKEMGSISMLRRVLEDTDDAEIMAVGIKVRVRLFFLSTDRAMGRKEDLDKVVIAVGEVLGRLALVQEKQKIEIEAGVAYAFVISKFFVESFCSAKQHNTCVLEWVCVVGGRILC